MTAVRGFERRALHDRLADNGVCSGRDLSVAQRAAHAVDVQWAVVAAAESVLARPDQLYRSPWADRLRSMRHQKDFVIA
jgi:hypothetical protein